VLYGKDTDEVFLGMDYSHSKNYSETYATQIDDEIKRIMTECFDKCEKLLTDHNDKLVLVAEELIKKEKISGERFMQLMDEGYDPANDVEEVAEEAEAPEVTAEVAEEVVAEPATEAVEEATEETTEE
jgi:cell division protease FtsH